MKLVNTISLATLLALGATLVGCLNDSGSDRTTPANLVISAGVKDVNKSGLGKTSVITLNKLIITLSTTDTTMRDTVLANDSANSKFTTVSTSNQTFTKNYSVKPLRSWTIVVKTLDVNDSVIHYDSVTTTQILAGQTRAVAMNLSSRFVMYEAKFSLPDSLNFTTLGFKQQLNVSRVYMIVDGDTVIDSVNSPRFAPSVTHSVRFDYMSVKDTPDVKIEFYGRVGSDTAVTKLFESLFTDVNPDSATTPTTATYTGPPGASFGSTAGLTISIGKVGTVIFQPSIPTDVTTKKAVGE